MATEHVILLHGLSRTSASMKAMQQALTTAGYAVSNIDYPSRTDSVENLAESALGPVLAACRRQGAAKIHFVTHSLGGILVRSYFSRQAAAGDIGNVVMLGPPNQGSEVVDRIGDWPVFSAINGPAGRELGTAPTSTPNQLGPTRLHVGVIAGTRSINWINSLMIPGPDDGKVSVERTKLAGMSDHLVVAASHPFLMTNRVVIRQTLVFLRSGRFEHAPRASAQIDSAN
jgi:pimeloyl-ACP methyl ester carboxylesterase